MQSSLERTAYPELSVRRGMRQTRPSQRNGTGTPKGRNRSEHEGAEATGRKASPQPYFFPHTVLGRFSPESVSNFVNLYCSPQTVTEHCERTGEEAEWSLSPH